MRLGLWYPLAAIDTDTAEYREHPEWAARERDGKVKQTGTAAGTKVVINTYGEAPGVPRRGPRAPHLGGVAHRDLRGDPRATAEVYRAHPDVLLDLTFELWGQKHLIDAGLLDAGDLDWLSNVHYGKPDSAGPRKARTLLYHRALAAPVEAMPIGNLRMPDYRGQPSRYSRRT